MKNILKSRVVAVIGAAAVLGTVAAGSATAGSLITSAQIKDNTVRSVDVKNGTLQPQDLSTVTKRYIKSFAGKNGVDGKNGKDGANGEDGANGKDGAPGSAAGVQTNWTAHNDAEILTDTSVRLTNEGDGSALQIENLNKPVQAGQTLSFTYRLSGGATYGGGVPRVFIEITGDYFNTFDGDPSDAGVDNGDGTFTKTVTIPKNGRVGEAGVVKDFGVGSVVVSNLTINGSVLHFR
jgi:hypothetical protein